MIIKPMLAAPTNDHILQAMQYPVLASAKIDGVRAIHRGILQSRKFLIIPNHYTRERFSHPRFFGLDGELACGNPYDKNLMQQTTSAVMTEEGQPNVKWYVFDKWDEAGGYAIRARYAKLCCDEEYGVVWLPQKRIDSWEQLQEFEAQMLEIGYEGLIVRQPRSPYKENRSTVKQGWMLKVKRFEDSEAIIEDVFEEMTNENEATIDIQGHTKRSSHAANKVGKGTLGGLRVKDRYSGVQFDIGTGFTAEQRANLWAGRKYLQGKMIKYKHFPIGVKDKPRHPVFLGFRDVRDT